MVLANKNAVVPGIEEGRVAADIADRMAVIGNHDDGVAIVDIADIGHAGI